MAFDFDDHAAGRPQPCCHVKPASVQNLRPANLGHTWLLLAGRFAHKLFHLVRDWHCPQGLLGGKRHPAAAAVCEQCRFVCAAAIQEARAGDLLRALCWWAPQARLRRLAQSLHSENPPPNLPQKLHAHTMLMRTRALTLTTACPSRAVWIKSLIFGLLLMSSATYFSSNRCSAAAPHRRPAKMDSAKRPSLTPHFKQRQCAGRADSLARLERVASTLSTHVPWMLKKHGARFCPLTMLAKTTPLLWLIASMANKPVGTPWQQMEGTTRQHAATFSGGHQRGSRLPAHASRWQAEAEPLSAKHSQHVSAKARWSNSCIFKLL